MGVPPAGNHVLGLRDFKTGLVDGRDAKSNLAVKGCWSPGRVRVTESVDGLVVTNKDAEPVCRPVAKVAEMTTVGG